MREPSLITSHQPPPFGQRFRLNLLRSSLQLLWFVITPLTSSGVILRYLTPYTTTAGGFEAAFADFAHEHTLLLALGLFLSLSAVLRYWRAFLPGGRYLFVLPAELAPRVPRRCWQKNLGFALAVGIAALLALEVRSHVFQAYQVSGSSMLPAFTPGEMLAGKVVDYGPANLPQRGEVVVLRVLLDGEPHEIVKRVLGLPGDRIAMIGTVPVINGWPVPFCDAGPYFSPEDGSASTGDPSGRLLMEFVGNEAYLTYQTTFAEPFPEYLVKPGEVFVLGDNRSNSRDSRNFDAGAARGFPISAIRAKITRVLFSRTTRGQLDPESFWRPLDYSFRLEGTDLSINETSAQRCLALRPKDARPPRAGTLSLASAPP